MVNTSHIVVADTGPIISLTLLHHLELLTTLFHEVFISPAVWEELLNAKPVSDRPEIQIFFRNRVRTIHSPNQLFPFVDYGESEAMLLYQELQAEYLLIDDKKAREVAEELGITCIGTLGLLYRAKEKGLIQELRPLFLTLIAQKRYYAVPILNRLLQKSHEKPI